MRRLKDQPKRALPILFAIIVLFCGSAEAQHVHQAGEPGSFFENLLKVYTPRKVCMFHEAPVIWLHVISDGLIALAYYSIPIALVYLLRRRKDMAFSGVYWLFAFFILACGTTHAIGVVDVWMPFYKIDGIAKAVTAFFSVATAVILWPLMPKAIAMASPAQLEQTVKERTFALVAANSALRAREEAVRASEDQLSAFFENSAVGAAQLDMQGRFVGVNRRLCEITGYTKEELLNRSLLELSHPSEKERDALYLRRFINEESLVYDFETRSITKQGREIWLHTSAGLIRDSGGRPWRLAAILQDVTERREADEALRASEQRFRELADSMPQIVWASRPDGALDYYNRRWYELTELDEGGIGDESWLSVMHPDDRQRCLDLWYDCVRTGKPYQIEYRFKFPSLPEYRWHLGRALPVYDDAGGVKRWYGTCTDIHDLKQTQDALHESDERFRLALQSSNTGWWRYEPATDTLEADPQVKRFLGILKDDRLNLENVAGQIHPEDRRAFLDRFEQLRSASGDYEVEFRAHPNNETSRWILVRGRSLGGSHNSPTHAMGIAIDISERKQLEEQLRAATLSAIQAKEAAERANSAKDQFLAVLSHELRTPLAPVLGAVTLIERGNIDEEIKEPLEIIKRNVQLEARLIDDLLDLTRIVRGKITLEWEPLDIHTVLDRVVEVCKPDIQARGMHLSLERAALPLMVEGDAARLQQVFWNLLKNAVKFSFNGGCIGISCRAENQSAVVRVYDSGIGIEYDALERIFDAFEQADEQITKQFGGLGLGLAISKKIVEMHGGVISASSSGKGRGASFTVALPLSGQNASEAETQRAQQAHEAELQKILLVEDHRDTAQMMAALLQSGGYQVQTAATAARALELLDEQDFDLLISDIRLPDRDGLQLMEEVRRRGKALQAIALSGFGREEDLRRSRDAGFADHLTKPVDFDALASAIQRIAERERDKGKA